MIFSLTKIARLYSQKNNITTAINFGSSAQLANNIEEGEPADVFISAHHIIVDSLKQKGLIDFYNNSNIVSDRLVIATSIDNPNLKDFNKSLDFNKYSPELICIEVIEKDLENSDVFNLLYKNRYKKIWSGVFSHIFKKMNVGRIVVLAISTYLF